MPLPGVAAFPPRGDNVPMTGSCGSSTHGSSRLRLGLGLVAVVAVAATIASTAAVASPPPTSPSWGAGRVEPRLAAEAMQTASGDTGVRVIAYGHDARKALKDAGAKHVKKLKLIDGARAVIRADAMEALLRDDDVSYIASDAPVQLQSTTNAASLQTLFPVIDGATGAWPQGIDGEGIGIALIDSGAADLTDFAGRLTHVDFDATIPDDGDTSGHGTFVAGVAGGRSTDGRYTGIAPGSRLFALDVQRGDMVLTSDIINALGWVVANRDRHGIRVVNLSLSETTPSAYRTSALDAAVESVWRAGVVVVVSAGNLGADSVDFAPANDPFVITVGATDSNFTATAADDAQATWSSRGTTVDGFAKPELLAPGRAIVAPVPAGTALDAIAPPDNHVEPGYLRMNGTSASAPQVAGAVALLLERRPDLTPDQVKWLLRESARSVTGAAPALDIAGALRFTGTVATANVGVAPSNGLPGATGDMEKAAAWERKAAGYEDIRAWPQAAGAWEQAARYWGASSLNVAIASHDAAADWMQAGRWDRAAALEESAAAAWSDLGSRAGSAIAWELAADARLHDRDYDAAALAFEAAARAWTSAGGADRASASWKPSARPAVRNRSNEVSVEAMARC